MLSGLVYAVALIIFVLSLINWGDTHMSQRERLGSKLLNYLEPIGLVIVVFSQPITMRWAGIWLSIVVCSDTPIAFRIPA